MTRQLISTVYPASGQVGLRPANLKDPLKATWTQVSGIGHKGVTHRGTRKSLIHIWGCLDRAPITEEKRQEEIWWVEDPIIREKVTKQWGCESSPAEHSETAGRTVPDAAASTPLPPLPPQCICLCAVIVTTATPLPVAQYCFQSTFPAVISFVPHLSQHRGSRPVSYTHLTLPTSLRV